MKLFVNKNIEETKEIIKSINKELLSDEDKIIYDILIKELN